MLFLAQGLCVDIYIYIYMSPWYEPGERTDSGKMMVLVGSHVGKLGYVDLYN